MRGAGRSVVHVGAQSVGPGRCGSSGCQELVVAHEKPLVSRGSSRDDGAGSECLVAVFGTVITMEATTAMHIEHLTVEPAQPIGGPLQRGAHHHLLKKADE